VIFTLAFAMQRPPHDDTTQPEPDVFNADRVLGRRLFDLHPARDALAAAVRGGRSDQIEHRARDFARAWRAVCDARSALDRQLTAVIERSQAVAYAMRTTARAVCDITHRALLVVDASDPTYPLLAQLGREADEIGATQPASCPPATERAHDLRR
jgi:hypothetical protein